MSVVVNTYHFRFSPETTQLVGEFAAKHYADERKAFKNAWKEWRAADEIKPTLDAEINRLVELGCKDDVEDKLFKSARYYYRKKLIREETEAVAKPVAEFVAEPIAEMATNSDPNPVAYNSAKSRVKNEKSFLRIIDAHILATLTNHTVLENNKQVCNVSPAVAFDDFTKTCDIAEEIHKKTYKNRFYVIRNKYVAKE